MRSDLVVTIFAVIMGLFFLGAIAWSMVDCASTQRRHEDCRKSGGYIVRGNDRELCLTYQQAVDIGLVTPAEAP